jgi:hypothetical protein
MMLAVDGFVKWNTFSRLAVHVGFVVDKVARGQVSLRVLRFSPATIVPQIWVCTDSCHHLCVDLQVTVSVNNTNNSRPPIRRSAFGLYSGLVWHSYPHNLPIGFNITRFSYGDEYEDCGCVGLVDG